MSIDTQTEAKPVDGLPPRPAFEITDESTAAWAVDKVLIARERLKRVKANYLAALKEAQAEVEDAEAYFLPKLAEWAAQNLPRGKRSVRTTHGVCQFRTVPGGPRVTDDERLIAWVKEQGIPGLVEVQTAEVIDRRAVAEYVQTTGEIPDGVEVVEARESFNVLE